MQKILQLYLQVTVADAHILCIKKYMKLFQKVSFIKFWVID